MRSTGLVSCCGLSFLAATAVCLAVEPADSGAQNGEPQPPVGIAVRTPWTTSRIVGSPDPPLPYETEVAFPALLFNQPIDMCRAPGMDRLFLVEQEGKVYSFVNDPSVQTAELAIDLRAARDDVQQVYAITCDPHFEQNGYCYFCCVGESGREDGTKIIRFTVNKTDPPTIDPASAHVVITWLSGGHNGCSLQFGPDGYLYISTGDGVGPNPPDTLRTGQDISDLLSSILRIDVHAADSERSYAIPPDNPFVNTPGARPEIWAYGFRNPWRMSFDPKTGDLWVGDVGWELWEMLIRVERGGNYGWSVMEGRQPANPEWPRGPTPILPPTIDHPHSESSSITAGVSYYGTRLPELVGAHIYGDYDTGKIWAVRWEKDRIAWHQELADTTLRIVAFAADHAGEVYLLHHVGGTIHRLVPNPVGSQPSVFPRRLSETGLFASVADHRPAPGVIPYSINAEPWEDGALAERFVAVPGEGTIKTDTKPWEFPANTVLAKTLSLDVRTGETAVRRRVETQILHYTGTDWRAYSYRWNDEQTDAVLVDAAGEERTLEVADPDSPDGFRAQKWRYSARAECLRCHNPWCGSALAFQPAQLNREHDYGGRWASQLDTFAHIGLWAPPVDIDGQQSLVDPHDPTHDLTQRARSYLHVNCSHCHRLHAGSSVLSYMQYDLSLAKTNMVGVRPTQGTFGIVGAEVVAAGDPFRSVLLYRMSKVGSGRMPHIGSERVDLDGVALIEAWIDSLPPADGERTAADEAAAQLRATERRLLAELCTEIQTSEHKAAVQKTATQKTSGQKPGGQDAQLAGCARIVDQLLATTSGALMLQRAVDRGEVPDRLAAAIVERAAGHAAVPVRDLFERFLPEERRVKRLGSTVDPGEILKLAGDVARGRRLFLETDGVHCKDCHRLENIGGEVGPDLRQIGKKLTPAQLLESILEPSKLIAPEFVTYLVETKTGRLHTGLLVSRNADEVVLKNAQAELVRVPTSDIEQLVSQHTSLMPELLVRDLTAQQVADLIAFLSSLRE